MLVIKRVHVHYVLQVDDDADRAAIDRSMASYRDRCPVYRSISAGIDFTHDIELVAVD